MSLFLIDARVGQNLFTTKANSLFPNLNTVHVFDFFVGLLANSESHGYGVANFGLQKRHFSSAKGHLLAPMVYDGLSFLLYFYWLTTRTNEERMLTGSFGMIVPNNPIFTRSPVTLAVPYSIAYTPVRNIRCVKIARNSCDIAFMWNAIWKLPLLYCLLKNQDIKLVVKES